MTRTMHDAVTAANIPTDATLVAGYIDADYAWSADDWQRFPHATLVRIAVYPSTNDGEVIDIEPGNWEPPAAPEWCRMRRAAGAVPTVYTMRDWWQWCIDEHDRQGEPQPYYWIADWDGDATLEGGMVAKQYANGTMLGTGYDLNVVADHWPGVDKEEEEMVDYDQVRLMAYRGFSDVLADIGIPPGTPSHVRDRARNLRGPLGLDDLTRAVAQNNGVTAEDIAAALTPRLSEAVLPELSAAVETVLGQDNQAQAQAIVEEMSRRLAGSEETS